MEAFTILACLLHCSEFLEKKLHSWKSPDLHVQFKADVLSIAVEVVRLVRGYLEALGFASRLTEKQVCKLSGDLKGAGDRSRTPSPRRTPSPIRSPGAPPAQPLSPGRSKSPGPAPELSEALTCAHSSGTRFGR